MNGTVPIKVSRMEFAVRFKIPSLSLLAKAWEMEGTMLVAKAAVIMVAKLMSGTAMPVR